MFSNIFLLFFVVEIVGFLICYSTGRTFKEFELAFPRDGEIIVGKNCDPEESRCEYHSLVYGWVWDPSTITEDMFPFTFHLVVNNDMVHNITVTALHYEYILSSDFSSFLDSSVSNTLDLVISLVDNNQKKYYEEEMTLLLALPSQYNLIRKDPSFSSLFPSLSKNVTSTESILHYFLSSRLGSSSISSSSKFDFIEVGTSEMDTIIQTSHSLSSKSVSQFDGSSTPVTTKQYSGISIDIINTYMNKLPDLASVLKLNLALSPLSSSSNHHSLSSPLNVEYKSVYYFPDFIIERLFPGQDFLKQIAEVDGIAPYLAGSLIASKLSSKLIQKEYIPAVSISSLLFILHQYYPKGLNVLKLDIEGLDQLVIKELLLFYSTFSPPATANDSSDEISTVATRISYHWPCLLFFETKYYETNREDSLMISLRESGYKLLHEQSEFIHKGYLNHFKFQVNSIAVNCHCSYEEEIVTGWTLLNLWDFFNFDKTIFNTICL
jgi:hypothetical protein